MKLIAALAATGTWSQEVIKNISKNYFFEYIGK